MSILTRHIYTWTLLLLFLPLEAQEKKVVEVSFSLEQFRMVETRENHFRVEALEEGYFYGEGTSDPALPLRSLQILVPNGAEMLDWEISYDSEVFPEALKLEFAPRAEPTSLNSFAGTASIRETSHEESFPLQVMEYVGTGIQRGYTWFNFQLSPFIYDGPEQSLSLITHLELEISYRRNQDLESLVRPTRELLQYLERTSLNPGDLPAYYPLREDSRLKSTGNRVDYLLITTEELRPGFEPLIEWKVRKGLKAEILTLKEIYSRYEGITDQLKIKNCLFDYYSNMELKWAFLAGDHDVVPVQGCYSEVNVNDFSMEDYHIPTDLFYACFDKRFDWNSFVDDKIGQAYRDGHDLLPEIYVARIPVRNQLQTREFVKKTLRYEQQPPTSDFAEKMLLSGVVSWNNWDGKSDNHHRSDLMYATYAEEAWQGEKIAFYDTGSDFPGSQDYQVSVENMSAQLNSGYGVFHYSGHANLESISMETGPRFTILDAWELSNKEAGIVLSTSCDVNAYDSIDPCLSESFLRNPDGGAVAFFGSTRYGFGYPDTLLHLGPSFLYNGNFLKYLFRETTGSSANSLGEVASLAKSDFVYHGSAGGAFHFLLYAINVLGDPELPLLTANPKTFDKVRLYRLGNSLTVNTGGLSDCRICVTSEDLSEGYQEVVEGSSYFTFEDVPLNFRVTITAPNYTPFQYPSGFPTSLKEKPELNIRVYPNPFSDLVRIDTDHMPAFVQVYNVHGSLILERELFSLSSSLDLSGFPKGLYLAQISSGGKVSQVKLLKR